MTPSGIPGCVCPGLVLEGDGCDTGGRGGPNRTGCDDCGASGGGCAFATVEDVLVVAEIDGSGEARAAVVFVLSESDVVLLTDEALFSLLSGSDRAAMLIEWDRVWSNRGERCCKND